ncbi:MAG: serine/threonine-protein phosphatase [Actinomycetota bacterium]|nr:serine/threonine-protein phosphatase [Actinomycetota bacterium]
MPSGRREGPAVIDGPTPGHAMSPAGVIAAVEQVMAALLRASSPIPPDYVGRLFFEQCRRAGLTEGAIFLVDCEQKVLVPIAPRDELGTRDIDTTLAGRAFQLDHPFVTENEDLPIGLWLPLLDGAERLGAVLLGVPDASPEVLDACQRLVAVVAELVVSKSQYGDALVLPRRRQPMSLAAELRWSLLPPLNFTCPHASLACILEPVYDVAGDAFDYAVSSDCLQVALFDAMGHGLEASRLANLAISAYRHARRQHYELGETYGYVDEMVRQVFGEDRFVTGQLAELDQNTGRVRWINAGHPPPLLVRDGKVSLALRAEPSLPFGIGGLTLPVAEHSLQPGDRVLFYTDGVVEARPSGGEPFGVERLVELTRRAMADHHTLAETARRLARSVVDHRQGTLEDDATIMLLAWHPERDAS